MGLIGVRLGSRLIFSETLDQPVASQNNITLYSYGKSSSFKTRNTYKSNFESYDINNNEDEILKKTKLFIKHNKITSQKKWHELELLFKLQVLNE